MNTLFQKSESINLNLLFGIIYKQDNFAFYGAISLTFMINSSYKFTHQILFFIFLSDLNARFI